MRRPCRIPRRLRRALRPAGDEPAATDPAEEADALRRFRVAGGALLVDVGANLADAAPATAARQLRRAGLAGLGAVIVTGTSEHGSAAATRVATMHAGGPVRVYATAGMHPHDAAAWRGGAGGTAAALRALLAGPRCVAVGECGLDYHRLRAPRPVQLAALRGQLELAAELRAPVFLHERERGPDKGPPLGSHADLVAAIDAVGVAPRRVLVHCFTGSADELRDYAARGYTVGVTGFVAIARRGAELRAALAAGALPLSQLVVETDAPFLRPDGLPAELRIGRGRRGNEPCALPQIVRAVAACLGVSDAEVADATTRNAERFFGL